MSRIERASWGTATTLLVLALWQIAATLKLGGLAYLPSPLEVARAAAELIVQPEFWSAIAHTVLISLSGWAIGSVIGIAAGLVIGLSPVVRRWSMTSIDMMRAIPIIAILPVMVLLLGLTTRMELFLVAYAAIWPVLINTVGGVAGMRPLLRDVARTLRLSPGASLVKLVIPSTAAPVSVGLSLALSLSLVIAVVAEIIGNPAGAGYGIVLSQSALRSDQMFAYIGAVGLLGLALNALLQWIYSSMRPGLITVRGAA